MPGDAVGKGAEHVQDGGVVKRRPHKPRARASRRAALPGSETAEAHAVSVWDQLVRPTSAKVALVAHSTGGTAAMHIASTFPDEFARRVFGLALLGDAVRFVTCSVTTRPLANGWPRLPDDLV